MSERASWFRCDASRLLGALGGMGPDCGYLYTVILMRIYEVGGPIEDDAGTLARRTGLALRRVVSALTWLVARGKVTLVDGRLDSDTTHDELSHREKLIIHAINAGNESAKRRAKFSRKKPKGKQQKVVTPVEPALNGGPTDGQRLEREEEGDNKIIDADASIVGETAAAVPVKNEKPEKKALRVVLKSFGEAWNELAVSLDLPEIDKIEPGSTREIHALARLRAMPQDGVMALMARIRGSPYLRGEVNGFRCTFDWVIRAGNYQKVMDGNYEDRKVAQIRR